MEGFYRKEGGARRFLAKRKSYLRPVLLLSKVVLRSTSTTTSKVMLKILQARLQQYVNRELQDVQAGFRKGGGTRNQIANIRWIMEKAREFQKNIYFCFIDYAKALTVRITINCGKF